ncbi:hypothetical protein [uncultured Adlercreutzia sp.]|uniref:hypothetical protein n=1 Tax=uncultured Adlercreutzia sp. TaxID=875803 RepID=UPI0026747E28|nr:hypothetical protein [uncultured Adlercreutzia sp.]
MPKVVLTASSPVTSSTVVVYESTLTAHRLKHPQPFTDGELIQCIEDPDIVAKTGHEEEEHAKRLVYYKHMPWEQGPPIMKAVVEHGEDPGVLTSAFRTSKYSSDGAIVHMGQEFKKGLEK